MNGYQITGDLLHLFAISFLLVKIWRNKSCSGISGKTQILFAITYICRYLDLFAYYLSFYNSAFKVTFIAISLSTCYLVFGLFSRTYEHKHDKFWIELLIIPAAVFAYFVNHDFNALEVLWSFSIYLESVAMLPQFYLIWNSGKLENFMLYYLLAMGQYRASYIVNWAYRYVNENHYDPIAVCAGVVQTTLYIYFVLLFAFYKGCDTLKQDKDSSETPNDQVYIISGKHALDVDKSGTRIVSANRPDVQSVFKPINEKTPKTGLASFTEFSTNLASNNAKNGVTLAYSDSDAKFDESMRNKSESQ